jgi:hypothetical protein
MLWEAWRNAMKRYLFLLTIAALVAVSGFGHGSPVIPFKQQLPQVPQLSSQTYVLEFKGGERAVAIASGDGAATYMGLYVYDNHGNCVAWDDDASWGTRDDLAVEWFPQRTDVYTIEVSNCGLRVNQCKVILR